MKARSAALTVAGIVALSGLMGTAGTPSSDAVSSAVERVWDGPNVEVPIVEGSAAEQLDDLEVKGRAPMTGYDADASFGNAWSDAGTPNQISGARDGCDTRNDILRRDLDNITIKHSSNGCVVLTGTLADPYSGTTITWERGPQSSTVQVDHVVAKGNAWVTGAQQLSEQQRLDFANDPLNLLAVDGPLNGSKSDSDAATWLPPTKTYRCEYVARQIAVKDRYGLWVTPPEQQAMRRVLNSCPDQPRADQGTSWKTPAPREGVR